MRVAAAIADPVRRDILMMLRRGPMSAGDIAARFAISRPAVSRHLRVLRESGLVAVEAAGRERIHRLELSALAPLVAWLAELRAAATDARLAATDDDGASSADRWSAALDALETEVYRTRRERRTSGSRSTRRSA